MTKPFVYEVRFLPGTEKDYLLERVASAGDRQGLPYEPDDVNWMALLSRQLSFRFLGRSGSLSVYLERSRSQDPAQRGDKPYWSAYRKAGGIQVKTYLGQDLTIGNLEAATARVAVRLKEKAGLSDEDLLLSARTVSGQRKHQERMTYLLDQLERKDQMMADLKQELATRDQVMINLKQELATRDQVMSDLKQELATRDQVMIDLKQELVKRDQVIAKLREHPSSQGKRRKPHGRRP
jgi:hypothetical protein